MCLTLLQKGDCTGFPASVSESVPVASDDAAKRLCLD